MTASTLPLPVAVLISGGGATLRNLIERQTKAGLPIDIRLVISSDAGAKGLVYARDAKIPSLVVSKKGHPTAEAFREAVFEPCRQAGVRIVVMGGFIQHVLIPPDFTNRVVNIHPSLIPAFCGKGFYGQKVHAAVLAFGAKLSGCTVHFVDDQYDHGPIILQRAVPVLDDDTPATLAARVFEQECEAYPDALRALALDEIEVVCGKVRRRRAAGNG